MSLVSCPGCGESVSDKAKQCPNCAYDFTEKATIICAECGASYGKDLSACPKCGCPTASEPKSQKKHTASIIVAIVIIISCILGIRGYKNLKLQEYRDNIKTVSYTMLNGAADAEGVGNLIKSVWSNAIYKRQDDDTDKFTMRNGRFVDNFNDALDALYSDDDFQKSLSEKRDNQSEVEILMKKLKKPPKEYEDLYALVQDYYEKYLKLTRLAISPTGSLNSFSEDFHKYDDDTVNAYDKIKIYLD